jgi:hypothetical protein
LAAEKRKKERKKERNCTTVKDLAGCWMARLRARKPREMVLDPARVSLDPADSNGWIRYEDRGQHFLVRRTRLGALQLRLGLVLTENSRLDCHAGTVQPWCVYLYITDTEKLPCHLGHARDVGLAMARPRPRPRTDWVLGVEDSESCIRSARPAVSYTQPTLSCPRSRSRIRN